MKKRKQELTSEEYVLSQIDKLQSRARLGEDEGDQSVIRDENDWDDADTESHPIEDRNVRVMRNYFDGLTDPSQGVALEDTAQAGRRKENSGPNGTKEVNDLIQSRTRNLEAMKRSLSTASSNVAPHKKARTSYDRECA